MYSSGLLSSLRRTLQFIALRNTSCLSSASSTIPNKALQFEPPRQQFSSIATNNDPPLKYHINKSISQVNLQFKRFKTRKGSRKAKDQEEEADDDEEDDDDDVDAGEENPLLMEDLPTGNDGAQQLIIDVNSLRLDAVAKVAFGCTRARIEEAFYKGELLINGEKAPKKSADLSLSDEVDLVLQNNVEDPTKIDIRRFQLITLPDKATDQGRMKIGIKKWFQLTVDPYTNKDIE